MRYLFGFMCVLALGVMPMLGCSETTGDGGVGGSAGTGGTGGSAGSGGTATLTLLAMEFDEEEKRVPLLGVRVCETGTTNCAVTDASGPAILQLPADQETSYTQEKEGYGAELRADIIPAIVGSTVIPIMRPDAWLEDMYERVTSPYPMEATGTIFIQVAGGSSIDGSIPGATLDLIGTTGKAFYLDEDGNWSTDPTATTSSGGGGFVEVTPGEYQIQIGGAAENCRLIRAWPGDSENRIRLPVREGYETTARVDCDEAVP
ncbi:MAG: hypothetical protein JRF55_06850 [Deltaproteobacteria bacterium]|nr:hypothetical protein [Deltaproteobacteria bacterium]